MRLDPRSLLVPALLLALGALLGVALRPESSSAQVAGASTFVPMVAGPGGVWVLQGNQVFVCNQGVQVGVRPAAPVCGPATALRPE